MPSTSRKRRSTARAYETIDRPKQTHFTPRNRTVAPRPQSLSAPRTRQQTLTQIDFVSRVPAEDEDDDLDYIFEDALRSRKRRKTMPETVSAPKAQAEKTRSTKRKAESNDRPGKAGTTLEDEQVEASMQTEPQTSTNTVMAPPKTPRKIVKTEIPSSQSPTTTPLSIQSRRSTRNESRSPLRDKSTNIRNTPSVHGRSIKKFSWLEVQDTFDDENEASQAMVQVHSSESNRTGGISEHDFAYSNPFGAGITIPNSMSDSGLSRSQNPVAATSVLPITQPTQIIKVEVRDSDSEGEEIDLEDDDYDAGADTQVALDQAEILVSSSSNEPSLHSDPIDGQPPSSQTDANHSTPLTADDSPNQSSTVDTPRPNHRLRKLYTSQHAESSTSPAAVPRTPTHIPATDEPSAQLYADLDQHTQPPLFSGTSLLEKASRPASPPKLAHNTYTTRSQRTQLQTQTQNTQVTQHLPSPLRNPLSSSPGYVPLSQATTADVTQASPYASRTQLPLSSQLPVTEEVQQIPSSQLQIQSQPLPVLPSSQNLSPQPLSKPKTLLQSPSAHGIFPDLDATILPSSQNLQPQQRSITPKPSHTHQSTVLVFSSSPLGAEGSSQASSLWDGRPLTDSQLLPDSLMDLTLPPPPRWTQESLLEAE
ncbi:hypothetical protein MMC30_002543 [Trapelia coarctata]|nr:hypothetical protein [Trapelia coarctata]